MRSQNIFILITITFVGYTYSQSLQDQTRYQLLQHVQNNSSTEIRPVIDFRTATNVSVDIALHSIIAMDSTRWVEYFHDFVLKITYFSQTLKANILIIQSPKWLCHSEQCISGLWSNILDNVLKCRHFERNNRTFWNFQADHHDFHLDENALVQWIRAMGPYRIWWVYILGKIYFLWIGGMGNRTTRKGWAFWTTSEGEAKNFGLRPITYK